MNNELMFSSNKNDWATPQSFYDDINKEFNFTLDAAATAEDTKCDNFLDDALNQPWRGNVFCNCPYSKAKHFIRRAYEEFNWEMIDGLIVMLLPARTDTIAFHEYIYHKAEIRFIKGRLTFGSDKYWAWVWRQEYFMVKGEKKKNSLYKQYGKKNAAPFPSILVIYR